MQHPITPLQDTWITIHKLHEYFYYVTQRKGAFYTLILADDAL